MTCPSSYADYCRYLDIRCKTCRALTGEGELHYQPLPGGESRRKHPAYQRTTQSREKDKTAARNNRVGRRMEKQVIESMGGWVTVGSGAVFSADLDGVIVINDEQHKIEHKTRIAHRNTLGPTEKEWEVMKKSGGSIFLTTHGSRTVITMDLQDFLNLFNHETSK